MNFGLLLLRLVVGGLFVGHGSQKLFGAFGGYGPEGTGGFFESLGLKPGKPMAYAAGASEAGGGAMLALGLGTPLAATALTSTMATAAYTVHRPNGLWAEKGGFEYNMVLATAALALASTGPGQISFDALVGRAEGHPRAALGALLLGVAGSAGAIAYGQRQPQEVLDQPSPPPIEQTDGATAE